MDGEENMTRFEITGSIDELLEQEDIADDGTAYDVESVVNVLKTLFSEYVTNPEGTEAGVSLNDDGDGYRVIVLVPGQRFTLASFVRFPGNANGVAFSDFRAEIGQSLAEANHMLDSWLDR